MSGTRGSADILFLPKGVADRMLTMLRGAMDTQTLGDPWDIATDIGPLITSAARDEIAAHAETARAEGRLIATGPVPAAGHFLPPLISVSGIEALRREVFGPVLHIARFAADDIDDVIAAIDATGYGPTFGLHSRINLRVQEVTARLPVGNIYVNRNQIGAVVGSQPFGGEGLSGTCPKAGGRTTWRASQEKLCLRPRIRTARRRTRPPCRRR